MESKLFICDSHDVLTEKINNWLDENPLKVVEKIEICPDPLEIFCRIDYKDVGTS